MKNETKDWLIMIGTAVIFYMMLIPLVGVIYCQFINDKINDYTNAKIALERDQYAKMLHDSQNLLRGQFNRNDEMLSAMIRACQVK